MITLAQHPERTVCTHQSSGFSDEWELTLEARGEDGLYGYVLRSGHQICAHGRADLRVGPMAGAIAFLELLDLLRARPLPMPSHELSAWRDEAKAMVREDLASRPSVMLAEFHGHPNAILDDRTNGIPLRRTLLIEEFAELLCAIDGIADEHATQLAEQIRAALDTLGDTAGRSEPAPASIARESADVKYVVYGTDHVYGIDADAALREVHRAAMQKMDAGLRRPEDGKIAKPPGFKPPNMDAAVQGSESPGPPRRRLWPSPF
ncbi:MAG: hypothetical protein JHD16_00215 [Solirubrobacteraceae bacterium]|nr:hypothetical protein [Solirubrobacteraceae bacterium]